jgi:transaldolase
LVWASAGPDRDADRVLRYLEELSAPNTVHALGESVVATLNKNGLGAPPPGIDARAAAGVLSDLAAVGIDLEDVGAVLEDQSAAVAQRSLVSALDRLPARWGHR